MTTVEISARQRYRIIELENLSLRRGFLFGWGVDGSIGCWEPEVTREEFEEKEGDEMLPYDSAKCAPPSMPFSGSGEYSRAETSYSWDEPEWRRWCVDIVEKELPPELQSVVNW